MIEIQNPKLELVNRQYSITNMLCIINPFSACQHSYLVSGHRFRVQGFTFNLNVDSIVWVIEYSLLRLTGNLELEILKMHPSRLQWRTKPKLYGSRFFVLSATVRACLFDILYYHKFIFGEIFRNGKCIQDPYWMII